MRVYPDQIHVDTHEPALSQDERQWGQHFWEQIWRAGHDEAAERRAWQQLADRFDAQRAAWIARALSPTNVDDWPTAPIAPDKPLPPAPKLAPAAMQTDPTRRQLAACAARARDAAALDRGRDRARRARRARARRAVDREPAVGPESERRDRAAAATSPPLDAGMRWMVDFDDAEKHGMALRLKMPAAVAQQGIDALVVFGVSSLDPAAASTAIASLLDAHHYTDGLGFLRVGTPTNNSAEAPSGWSSQDPLHARSFATECRSAAAAGRQQRRCARARARLRCRRNAHATLAHAVGRSAARADRRAADGGRVVAGDLGLLSDEPDRPRRHRPHARCDRLGARALHRARARRSVRCRHCASAASRTACCRSRRSAATCEASRDARERWLATTLKTLLERCGIRASPDVPRVGRSDDPAQDLAAVMKSDGDRDAIDCVICSGRATSIICADSSARISRRAAGSRRRIC